MSSKPSISHDCIMPDSTFIESGVFIGPRVVINGENVVIRSNSRIDSGSTLAGGIEIGQGAWVKSDSFVNRSVPANAVAQGNPACVIGYLGSGTSILGSEAKLIDTSLYESLPRPHREPLGIGGSELYLMRNIIDERGALSVGEVPSELPFLPKRYFVVYNVPSVELRGEHAHRRCEQFLVCLNGSCRILLDDGTSRCEVTLSRPDVGVYMPPMIWGTQYKYSSDAVLLVFASLPYDSSDYIRSYDQFLASVG